MLSEKEVNVLFGNVEVKLIKGTMNRIYQLQGWYNVFPNKPGVYAVINHNNEIVYVGETSNLRERMRDLNDTRHHTLRRSVGFTEFATEPRFHKATSKNKFPEHIERLVTDFFIDNLSITYITTKIGRKEIEEYLLRKYKPKYNSALGRRHTL